MKINLLTSTLIAGAVALAGLSSCSSDDDSASEVDRGQKVTVTSPAGKLYFERILPVVCEIDYYDNKTADVRAYGTATYPDGGSITFDKIYTNLPYKTDKDGVNVIDLNNFTDENGQSFKTLEIYSGQVPSNVVNADGAEIFSFEIAFNMSEASFVPDKAVCMGSTKVVSAANSFNTTETSYIITFKDDYKADLTVHNAKFAQGMPSVGDMVFADLDVAYEYGGCTITKASLIPSIAGVPYPTFAISALAIDVEFEDTGDVDLTFKCNAFGQAYTVTADDMSCYPLGSSRSE